MRHKVKGVKLNRTASHRKALMRNLATSLIKHKRIKTTLAKAKALKVYIEPIITKAKENDLSAKKYVMELIKEKDVVKTLFNEVVETVSERKGGYTRVVKLGQRLGDAAEMAIIELVDYNEAANLKAAESKEKKEAKAKEKKEKKTEETEEANIVEEKSSKKK
ncbi:MAG: 50S ribosomal protein L17 [Ignavibacteriales bacterium]|jgi:large subunit ribosomal protein L17|nr:50S ribosomal protein L17 [Ignavibacteriaceae bacterium]NLH62125.1 50S ribosomal protein L17 [Ignavibacteriales bacterium]HOJ17825.1 50S ribosomal protein L17 [Ignavibacteriaceae bacterium]HPO55028.1 50S ribosomal protein L17 [Ignavibacteriaceae bacterium]